MAYQSDMNTFVNICHSLGVPLAADNVVSPTQRFTFLGIEIDYVSMTICLPRRRYTPWSRDIRLGWS